MLLIAIALLVGSLAWMSYATHREHQRHAAAIRRILEG